MLRVSKKGHFITMTEPMKGLAGEAQLCANNAMRQPCFANKEEYEFYMRMQEEWVCTGYKVIAPGEFFRPVGRGRLCIQEFFASPLEKEQRLVELELDDSRCSFEFLPDFSCRMGCRD